MHKEFGTYRLNVTGEEKCNRVRISFDTLLSLIEELCPAGRELAIVKTKLEEAGFFAMKSIAGDPSNNVGPARG